MDKQITTLMKLGYSESQAKEILKADEEVDKMTKLQQKSLQIILLSRKNHEMMKKKSK